MLFFTHAQPPLLLQFSHNPILNLGMKQREGGITRVVTINLSLNGQFS